MGAPKARVASLVFPFALLGFAISAFVMDQDGPGDRPQDFVAAAIGVGVGLLAALAYVRLERSAERAERVRFICSWLIASFLASTFVSYGVVKLAWIQFGLQYASLDLRAIELAPRKIAWVFFGHNYGYQAAIGLSELAAAVLLCFRRTRLAGTCLLLVVVSNVVLVNFAYDVPVKLYSTGYLAMTLFLLVPDVPRLWAFFLGDQPVHPRPAFVWRPRGSPRAQRIARIVWIAFLLLYPTMRTLIPLARYSSFRAHSLVGIYSVEHASGVDAFLEPDDREAGAAPVRWERAYLEPDSSGSVRAGKERVIFDVELDESRHRVRLRREEPARLLEGRYVLEDKRLEVRGTTHDDHPFRLELVRQFD